MKHLIILPFFVISLQAFTQVQIKDYQNNKPALIGTIQSRNIHATGPLTIYEGGYSGLVYIKGSYPFEFYVNTDRGPNIDGKGAPYITKGMDSKIFPFPEYVPKIFKIKLYPVGNIDVIETIPLKRPDNSTISGLPNPTGFGGSGELAYSDNTEIGAITKRDTFGIDTEGITLGSNNNFWICDEYGASVLRIDRKTGIILQRFVPYSYPAPLKTDITIPSVYSKRVPNRGFEGVTMAPNGKLYAVMQSPMSNPSESESDKSRIHRILEIDPKTNATKTYVYVNNGVTGGEKDIRSRDWKLSDITAVNNTQFLVIEQASRGSLNRRRVILMDLKDATPILSEKTYGTSNKVLEELAESKGSLTFDSLNYYGIKAVAATTFLDLNNETKEPYSVKNTNPETHNMWDPNMEKCEGLAIINDSTIALANDNDYGLSGDKDSNGTVVANGVKSHVILYYFDKKVLSTKY